MPRMTGPAMLRALALAVFLQTPAPAEPPPNIVFIMADDLGHGHLGCYGQRKIRTPHIDRLATEGVIFSNFYSGSHVCAPSRSVLMTGLHTGHTPIRANGSGKSYRDDDVTVAELLKQAGYATGAFGKWGGGVEGTEGHPNRQGFDEFFGQLHQVHAHFYYPYWLWHDDRRHLLPGNEGGKRRSYAHDIIHARALDFIRRHEDRPFFAYLPYIIPHVELVVPEDSEKPYRGKFPKVEIRDPRPGYIGSDDALVTVAGMISRLDRHVGEISALIEELGLDRRTLVVFTSDNGAQGGPWKPMSDFFEAGAGLAGYKGSFREGGIRVPLVARWPGRIPAGRRSDHVGAFQDILATLCDIAGGAPPGRTDGISLLAALTGVGVQRRHDHLYWEHGRGKRLAQALRLGRWKLLRPRPDAPWQVHDLQTDPGETRDLAREKPEIIARARSILQTVRTPPRRLPKDARRPGIGDYVR